MKKIVVFFLAVVCTIGLSSPTVMAQERTSQELLVQASQEMEQKAIQLGLEVGKEYEYKYADGTVQKYYLDEGYNPYYVAENGEQVFLALPLIHTTITNEELLEAIHQGIPQNLGLVDVGDRDISLLAPPTNYHDLTNKYTATYNFSGDQLYYPMFKVPSNYPTIRITTSSYVPATQKKLFIIYTIYDTLTGSAVASGMFRGSDGTGVDCTLGLNISGITTASRFIGLSVGRAGSMTSCKFEVIKYSNW